MNEKESIYQHLTTKNLSEPSRFTAVTPYLIWK